MHLHGYYQPPTTTPPAAAPAPAPLLATNGDKSQTVRLGDIFLFGPLMILGAINKTPPKWMRAALVVIGVGTIAYNARNYLVNLNPPNLPTQ